MAAAAALAVVCGSLAGLRCARDCFACPALLAADECCGARSFCGWVGDISLDVPVALLKTHAQSLRNEPVPISCNHNAEPYLSVGVSVPTCSIAATILANDAAYAGPLLKCDFGRRIQLGNASVAACEEGIRAWASIFGLTAEPTPNPSPAPTREPSLAPTLTTVEPTENVPVYMTAHTLPVTATALTGAITGEPAKQSSRGALTWIMLAGLIVCILLNVGLAIVLATKRVSPPPDEPEAADDDWVAPPSFSNPSYEPPRDAVYNDMMPAQAVYEIPSATHEESFYDPATLDNQSVNSAC